LPLSALDIDIDVNKERRVTTAFVFPGQGSWRPDALRPWDGHPAIRVLDEVEAGLGRDLRALAADTETGRRTADAQPAILATSLVAWKAVTDAGVQPDAVAGHSLGEVTATVAAGALSALDAGRVVAARAAAMGAACQAHPGTMTALVRLEPRVVQELVEELDGLVLANDNAPGQVVVAGPEDAVKAAADRARELGGRALPVEVEGAFHSPAMAEALDPVADVLADAGVRAPTVPLVSGCTADEVRTADAVIDALITGIRQPVRWREVQLALADRGVTRLVELGPGGVLKGLARRTVPELEVLTVATPDDVDDLARTVLATTAH
jgi:[acyl-carrier-protein] S-malonyltransferase